MTRIISFFLLFSCLALDFVEAQSIDALRQKINLILADKSATVGVAIRGTNPQDTIYINGEKRLPMQSVFKYHLALAVLDQVDRKILDLNQTVVIDRKLMETYQHLWSPLRKKYPEGARVTLKELIMYTVSWSDNVGCDVLFKIAGGTEVVQSYLHSIGIEDISITHTEISMQSQWNHQYENWTTAKAANKALRLFFENTNELFSETSHSFLLDIMKGTKTGTKRIRGLLPEETPVAHKTGYSGKNDKGVTGAMNNIGIVFLPNGSYFYISVLVSDSMESDETNEKIIAEIAKLVWDYFEDN